MKRLIFSIILIVIIIILCLFRFINGKNILSDSSLVKAVIVESEKCYTQSHYKHKNTGNGEIKIYVTEIFQHMVLEYEEDGKTIQKDVGGLKIGEYEVTLNISENE